MMIVAASEATKEVEEDRDSRGFCRWGQCASVRCCALSMWVGLCALCLSKRQNGAVGGVVRHRCAAVHVRC